MTTEKIENQDERVATPAPAETTPPSPASGQGGGDDGQSFDKADYTRKTQELAVLKRMALDAGYDDPQDYISDLEYKASGGGTPPETTSPPETKPDGSGDMTALQQKIADLEKNQSMINKQNTITLMGVMYSDYIREQKELEADKKFGFSKKELNAFMLDRRNASVIGDVAHEEEANGESANWYKIAADMMDYKKSRAAIKKEGATQQEALAAAADSATALGTTAPPPETEEKKTAAQKRAERIAPDTRQKF